MSYYRALHTSACKCHTYVVQIKWHTIVINFDFASSFNFESTIPPLNGTVNAVVFRTKPNTLLFATNNEGRIYALSTGSTVWKEFQYSGLEFKKISSGQNIIYAIGGDRQVYVLVFGLDIPIRVKEVAYENERWFPIEGFANRLLPTDRYKFSNEDGTENRAIQMIRLPSACWIWEGEWQLDLSLNGEPLDHDGWTYAIDFPAKFGPKKSWNSCVRRRKWVRTRRYNALNSWCAIAPLHKDATQEPFVDVAIGCIGSETQSTVLSVWAVSAHGRIMHRSGVSMTSPEGQRWTAIPTPTGEILNISVGATGLVWAVLYSGRALARTGIRSDNLIGDKWVEISAPGENLKIIQVSVGTNAVWCVTNDNHVWFRRGVKGDICGISEDAAIGNGWVEMVGNISQVSVAANDQVFAIGADDDRYLYFRWGVSTSDLTGKRWVKIQCPLQYTSCSSSTLSLNSRRSGSESPIQSHRSINTLYKERGRVETSAIIENVSIDGEDAARSAPNFRPKPKCFNSPPGSLNEKVDNRYKVRMEEYTASSAPTEYVSEISGKHYDRSSKHPRAWSPVRSVGSMVGTEVNPESDSSVFETDSNRGSCIFSEEDDQCGTQYWSDSETIWTNCTAGAVLVEPNQLPGWFKDTITVSDSSADLNKEWRVKMIENLKQRLNGFDTSNYEKAIEMSSWVKSIEAKVAKNDTFEDGLIELEWLTSSAATSGSGTLTILNLDGVTTKLQLSLNEITCVMCSSEPGHPRIALYTPNLSPESSAPLKLEFANDDEMEDWLSHLTSVCCELNEVHGQPASDSRWITTGLGDVFCFDPVNLKAAQFNRESKLFEKETNMLGAETPYYSTLPNGMEIGSILEINGCIFDDASQIRFDLQCHSTLKTRFIVEKMRHVACHLNPRFNEKIIVLNTMENSEWQNEMRTDKMVFAPGSEFKLEIRCEANGLRFFVDDIEFVFFEHRLPPEAVNSLYISGRVKIYNVKYKCPRVIILLRDMFWRQIGGHFRKIVSSRFGIVWAISYDNTAYYYTNGWGGAFLKGLSSGGEINPMTDTQNYFIYENQRWNPLTGYTSHGLPTDRHMWSDATGKQKRSKENSKLLSSRWHWISDWIVDFHTPGGVDRDGWQYAVDFPASYHAKKHFTDYVRRRRWFRKCRLTTSGPWHEIGNTKVIDVSLLYDEHTDMFKAWAIASNGDALYRRGVTKSSPAGSTWEHIVANNQPLVSISLSKSTGVWAIGRNGSAYRRCGFSSENECGTFWKAIEDAPKGTVLKQISVGAMGIWAIDSQGQILVRREVCDSFPEGSHWQVLQNIPNDPPHEESKMGFRSVSVTDTEVWAVSNSSYVCKRSGVTSKNPAGTGWQLGISANFNCIS